MFPTLSSTNPLQEISDLDHLPLQACVELTRQLLTSISLPTQADSLRAVLKTVILLSPNMTARPTRTERGKPLRLARLNADGVRGRKLELEHFLIQHVVKISLKSDIP